MKLTAMKYLNNYYSQFYHPFCEQVPQLTLSTGEAIFFVPVVLSGSPVTKVWRVLRLRMETTASRYGG
jgi:hypothetical protein